MRYRDFDSLSLSLSLSLSGGFNVYRSLNVQNVNGQAPSYEGFERKQCGSFKAEI